MISVIKKDANFRYEIRTFGEKYFMYFGDDILEAMDFADCVNAHEDCDVEVSVESNGILQLDYSVESYSEYDKELSDSYFASELAEIYGVPVNPLELNSFLANQKLQISGKVYDFPVSFLQNYGQ